MGLGEEEEAGLGVGVGGGVGGGGEGATRFEHFFKVFEWDFFRSHIFFEDLCGKIGLCGYFWLSFLGLVWLSIATYM